MNEKEILNKLNELKENENWENLMIISNECSFYNGSTDEIHYNSEEFFNVYFENNILEAVRSVCYGDYRYTDDYVVFDGYENLESFNLYDMENYLDLDNMAYQISEENDIYENVKDYL